MESASRPFPPSRFLVSHLRKILAAFLALTSTGFSQSDQAALQQILEESNSNPAALRRLDQAPIQQIFEPLRHLWLQNETIATSSENRRLSSDPEKALEIARNAKEALLAHEDLESYLSARLDEIKTIMVEGPEAHERTYAVAVHEQTVILDFACHLPGDMAFRIVGSYLDAPHFPPVQDFDMWIGSPAACAAGDMIVLVNERLGQSLPRNVSAVRSWWDQNKTKFALPPGDQVAQAQEARSARTAAQPIESLHVTEAHPQVVRRVSLVLVAAGLLACVILYRVRSRAH